MIDPNSIIFLVILLIAAAIFAGLLAGLLGIGGGSVIVPTLFHVFHIIGYNDATSMRIAIGTSLATIVSTSISSTMAHYRSNNIDLKVIRSWAPGIIFGVVLGILVASYVQGTVLTAIFASITMLIALYLLFVPSTVHISEQPPGPKTRTALSVLIGSLSTMVGIGGGTLVIPSLTLFNYPIRLAIGTASALGLVIALPGALGFIISGWNISGLPPGNTGFVSWLSFCFLAPIMYIVAPFGVRMSQGFSPRILKFLFAIFLIVTSLRFSLRLLGF